MPVIAFSHTVGRKFQDLITTLCKSYMPCRDSFWTSLISSISPKINKSISLVDHSAVGLLTRSEPSLLPKLLSCLSVICQILLLSWKITEMHMWNCWITVKIIYGYCSRWRARRFRLFICTSLTELCCLAKTRELRRTVYTPLCDAVSIADLL